MCASRRKYVIKWSKPIIIQCNAPRCVCVCARSGQLPRSAPIDTWFLLLFFSRRLSRRLLPNHLIPYAARMWHFATQFDRRRMWDIQCRAKQIKRSVINELAGQNKEVIKCGNRTSSPRSLAMTCQAPLVLRCAEHRLASVSCGMGLNQQSASHA